MRYFFNRFDIGMVLGIAAGVLLAFSLTVYAASVTAKFPGGLNNFAEGDTIEEEDWNAIEAEIGARAGNTATGTTDSINYIIRNGKFYSTTLSVGSTATTTLSNTATSTFQKGISATALDITGSASSTFASGIVLSGGLNLSNLTGTTNCLQLDTNGNITAASASCGTGSGGGSDPFLHPTNFGTTTSATGTPLWLQGSLFSLFASSTAVFVNASTTQLTIGSDFLTDLSTGFSISAAGVVTLDTTGDWTGTFDGVQGADYTLESRALTIAGTANQITSSAGAQDLTADRTWTLSLPSHVIFPTSFVASLGTTTNATSTNLTVTSNFIVEPLTSALVLTGSGGAFAEYTGASCTNQFPQSQSATGGWTCDSVVLTTDVSGDLPFANLTQIAANSVLGNNTSATGDVAAIATSTLFGATVTAGQVLMSTGSGWTTSATATCEAITGGAGLCDGTDATGAGGGGTGWASTTDAFSIYFTGRDYVGIGTSTPSARLSVQQLNTTTLGGYIAGYSNATADIFRISTSTASATTTAFVIDSKGRVGVGLTSPTAQLEVVGIASSTNLTVSSLNAASCDVKSTNGVFSCGTDASGSSASLGWASTTDAFSIYFTGRDYVGIGTTSPYAPLSVVGSKGIVTGKIHATSSTDTSTFDTPPTFSTLTSALIITGAGGLLAEYGGAAACTNQFVTAISVLGATTCASINNDYWSGTDLSVANGGTGLSTFGGTNTILYTSAADTLTSDSLFVFNGTLDRLGIGTSTPNWVLQAASSSPMFTLTDTDAGTDYKHGSFSYIDGIFRISTTSDSLLASTTIISIDPVKPASLSVGSTTQTISAVNGLITQGSNGANGSSTMSVGKWQIDGYNSAGTRSCIFLVGTTFTAISGACNP